MTHEPFDLVIYHANCLDGFAAAWAARKHSPDAEFIPATYGDDPPPMQGTDAAGALYGKRVLVVDFSYPRETLLMMRTCSADLLVLDHHKTAAEDLAGLDFAVFDMERSGCGITWDVLHPDEVRPALIDHVEDRDLWRFAILETRAFIAGLTAEPLDFDVWSEIAAPDGSRYRYTMRSGVAVRGFTRKTCESIASRAYAAGLESNLGTLKPQWSYSLLEVLAVNCPPQFVSDTADILKPRAAGRAIVGWFFDGERGDFVFSLRSADDGPDVSEIARAFGGGGHKHAAGFRCGHNPLVKS